MDNAKISVIMLAYNREKLVSRAIESVLSQTYQDFEFVIVDNGSTDNSGSIADEYARKDSRIRVIHKEKGNIGSGRNAGLDTARGQYIAFIDDDDWCETDYLEFLYKLAVDNDADIAICGSHDKQKGESAVMGAEDALVMLFERVHYNNQFPTKLIRRDLFDNHRFSDTAKYDDIELMTYIIASAWKVAYDGDKKYTFYRHDGNNSRWTTNHSLLNPATLDEYIDVYRKRTEWLCGRFPENSTMWRYFEWSFMISMIEKISRLEIKECEKQRSWMVGELAENMDDFMRCERMQDFEKEWIDKYVRTAHTSENNEKLHIWRVRIFPTLQCNLRCKLCTVYAPYYKSPPKYPFETFAGDIDRLFEIIDTIGDFEFSGGEPLLVADLARYSEYLHRYDSRISGYILVTNGTLLPSDEFLRSIKPFGEKFRVILDDYGEISSNVEQVKVLFSDNGNTVEIRTQANLQGYLGGWLKAVVGREAIDVSIEGVLQRYKACSMSKRPLIDLRDGICYHCDHSITYYDMNNIEPLTEDTINLFDANLSDAEIRQRLSVFRDKDYYESCKYCTGIIPEGKRYTPAVQLTQEELRAISSSGDTVAQIPEN